MSENDRHLVNFGENTVKLQYSKLSITEKKLFNKDNWKKKHQIFKTHKETVAKDFQIETVAQDFQITSINPLYSRYKCLR